MKNIANEKRTLFQFYYADDTVLRNSKILPDRTHIQYVWVHTIFKKNFSDSLRLASVERLLLMYKVLQQNLVFIGLNEFKFLFSIQLIQKSSVGSRGKWKSNWIEYEIKLYDLWNSQHINSMISKEEQKKKNNNKTKQK